MKSHLSDKNYSQINKRNPIILLGIGAFGWVTIASFAYLIEQISKNICFHFGIRPSMTFFMSELASFLIYIIGILIFIRIFKSENHKDLGVFIITIISALFVQILQFIVPSLITKIHTTEFLDNSIIYYEYMNDNPLTIIISFVLILIVYLVTGLIIYMNSKNSG